MDGHNALLQSIDAGSYVIDLCSLKQLCVISIQVMTERESVDELFHVGS